MRKEIPPSQFIAVTYNELLADPQQTVQKIYKHFGWQLSDNFNEQLSKEQKRSSTYKSAHEYSLQEYGLSKEYIYNQLGDIMDEYGFEKEF